MLKGKTAFLSRSRSTLRRCKKGVERTRRGCRFWLRPAAGLRTAFKLWIRATGDASRGQILVNGDGDASCSQVCEKVDNGGAAGSQEEDAGCRQICENVDNGGAARCQE